MKLIYSIILLLWLFPLAGKEVVIFEKPALDAGYAFSDDKFWHDTGERQRVIVRQHPLAFIFEYSKIRSDNGLTAFHRKDIVPGNEAQSFMRRPPLPATHISGIIAAVVFMIAIIQHGIRKNFSDTGLILLPVLLRIALVLLTLCRWDSVYPIAADENGYFATITDMLNGNWRTPWHFTVGTGFFYLPFIFLTDAKIFYDIVPYFNYFSALIIAPGIMVLAFLILRKLGVPGKKSCIAMLIWAIYPFVAFHLEDWNSANFQHLFLLTRFFRQWMSHFFYAFCINAGFNAMSDTPGLLLLLGCLYLALAMPKKIRYAVLFGMLYGFTCMVRINYILLSPLFAYVLFCKFKDDRAVLLKAAAAGIVSFLVIFSFQMICNVLQFSSPLTFGYILHYPENNILDRPVAGFTWHTFSKLTSLRYLLQVNLPVFAFGTAALWVTRDRHKQRIFALLSIPVVLFFCGYSHTFCDARRFVFPAFAGFLMAVTGMEIWDDLRRHIRAAIISGLFLLASLALPYHASWRGLPFMLGEGLFLRIASVAIPVYLGIIVLYLIRQKQFPAAIFLSLAALFYYSPPEVTAAAMFLLLLKTMCPQFPIRMIREKFRRHDHETSRPQ